LPFFFCHCIVCRSSIYSFWLPLWYLQASLCPFVLFLLSLYCLSFFYLRLLITTFVSSSFSLSSIQWQNEKGKRTKRSLKVPKVNQKP
jgi:hypothetical protein